MLRSIFILPFNEKKTEKNNIESFVTSSDQVDRQPSLRIIQLYFSPEPFVSTEMELQRLLNLKNCILGKEKRKAYRILNSDMIYIQSNKDLGNISKVIK